jgi:hypothetical protein
LQLLKAGRAFAVAVLAAATAATSNHPAMQLRWAKQASSTFCYNIGSICDQASAVLPAWCAAAALH